MRQAESLLAKSHSIQAEIVDPGQPSPAPWTFRALRPGMFFLHAGLKDKGLALLAVNILDTPKEAQRVIDKYHLPYPVGLDSKAGGGKADVGSRYHADAGGLNILIGPDGKIVWLEAGLNEKHLRCVLERMGIPAL